MHRGGAVHMSGQLAENVLIFSLQNCFAISINNDNSEEGGCTGHSCGEERRGGEIIRLTQPLLIFQLEIQHPRTTNSSPPPSKNGLEQVWFEDVCYGVSWEEKFGEKSGSNWTVITVLFQTLFLQVYPFVFPFNVIMLSGIPNKLPISPNCSNRGLNQLELRHLLVLSAVSRGRCGVTLDLTESESTKQLELVMAEQISHQFHFHMVTKQASFCKDNKTPLPLGLW